MKSTTIHTTFAKAGPLSQLALDNDLTNFEMCMSFFRVLPYGRNAKRDDFRLVFIEKQGTCSSKHAALKSIAQEQGIQSVQLTLCLYKMNSKNTPGIGPHIQEAGLAYIPEAHCYLDIDGEKVDLTTTNASMTRIENDILYDEIIQADQVNTYKVNLHKKYIQDWLYNEGIKKSIEEVWAIRERCISSLSAH